ncbi:MAG TPA: hypothetical protein VF399_00755 [bacterium]|jgi:hypothetical protein
MQPIKRILPGLRPRCPVLLISLLMLMSLSMNCQREHTNAYDICNENFYPPRGVMGVASSPVYDPYGTLVAVDMYFYFVDKFDRATSFDHRFYQDISEVMQFDYAISANYDVYGVSVSYGGAPFPIGTYCMKTYYAELPVAGCRFDVIASGTRRIIVPVTEMTRFAVPDIEVPRFEISPE